METKVIVDDATGVADARRQAAKMAEWVGLPDRLHGEVTLVVSEAASNILKYAQRGEILLRRTVHSGATTSLEMIALDKGPGIRNIAEAMRDGHSTGGSLGAGLGTMQRRASFFDIYSVPDQGTAVLAQFSAARGETPASTAYGGAARSGAPVSLTAAPSPQSLTAPSTPSAMAAQALPGFLVGARSTPRAGQDMCGDAWAVVQRDDALWVAVLDGLGHGPLAHHASNQGIDYLRVSNAYQTPDGLAEQLHKTLRGTRGAVVGLAKISRSGSVLDFTGVGNIIAGVFRQDSITRLLSTDGTVGYMMHRIRPTQSEWRSGSVYIASTDGLSTRWNLSAHPNLLQHHPSLIAAVLHRDFARDNDDATVVVVKGV
ncbi:ATP-binding SpoIIE family protein phosphatase [Robbsia sp. KACC 23696]|uniref:ATP-binding SpoIIE family protein phosphatase n=1 Tax=Robbsia sp. KACC 23696 TaxID=3149231 RepID=UPI00325BED93